MSIYKQQLKCRSVMLSPMRGELARKLSRAVATVIGVIGALAASSSGYESEFAGLTVTLERMLAVPALVISLFLGFHRGSFNHLFVSIAFSAWLMVSLIPSLLGPVPHFALRMWLILALAASYFYSVRLAKLHIGSVSIRSGVTFSAILLGPVAAAVYVLGVVAGAQGVPSEWIHESGGGLRLKGPLLEPNLYACLAGVVAILVVSESKLRRSMKWLLLLGLNFGLLFSFSRLPWIAYISGLGVYFAMIRPMEYRFEGAVRLASALSIVVAIVSMVGYVLWAAYPDLDLMTRTGSISTRLMMWDIAASDIANRPWLGSGVFSFGAMHPTAMYAVGSESVRAAWVSNLPLLLLHDSGLIGLALFSAGGAMILAKAGRSIRNAAVKFVNRDVGVREAAGLYGGAVALLVSSLSIPSYSMCFFWIIFALIETSVSRMKKMGECG